MRGWGKLKHKLYVKMQHSYVWCLTKHQRCELTMQSLQPNQWSDFKCFVILLASSTWMSWIIIAAFICHRIWLQFMLRPLELKHPHISHDLQFTAVNQEPREEEESTPFMPVYTFSAHSCWGQSPSDWADLCENNKKLQQHIHLCSCLVRFDCLVIA